MKALTVKGDFQPIDGVFLTAGLETLQNVSEVQNRYHKLDTDTFINEIHDSMVARCLYFSHVNIEKHGFDARRQSIHPDCAFDYLEVKAVSFSAKSWGATFNDTNLEKAEAFKAENVYLALSVWRAAADLLFIAYGQSPDIGAFLEEKVRWFKAGHTVRSTQSISLADLVLKYGFKIYAVHKKPADVFTLLQAQSGCSKIPLEAILPITDLPEPACLPQ